MRRLRRLAAATALAVAACSRTPPATEPEEDPDPADRIAAYTIATGDRVYELHVSANGFLRFGPGLTAPDGTTVSTAAGIGAEDVPFAMDATVRLRARIVPEGEARRVTMTYDSVVGEVVLAGVAQPLTSEQVVSVPVPGETGPSAVMSPDGTISDLRDGAGNLVPPRVAGGLFSCPGLPPGGAAPAQEWKVLEPVGLAGLGGTMVATNGYTLEGDNSAVVTSRSDGPLEASGDAGSLAARFPPLATALVPVAGAGLRATGDAVVTSACELTWPEQELLAITTEGRWRLTLSSGAADAALQGAAPVPGELFRLDVSTRSELRSV